MYYKHGIKTVCCVFQLDMCRSQQERLREVSEARRDNITQVAHALEAVTDNLRRMRTSIDRAADELDMHEPIGTDVNAIKRLQDELKVSVMFVKLLGWNSSKISY